MLGMLTITLATLTLPVAVNAQIWTTGGPDGAEISAIVADPGTPGVFYASGFSTHIWRSTDYGESWSASGPVVAPQISYDPSIQGLAIDPGDGQHLVAAVSWAQEESGLYESHDGGASWSRRPAPFDHPSTVLIDPRDPELWLVAGWTEIFRSTDGGGTWSALGFPGGIFITSLSMDPVNADFLLASGVDHVYRSTDQGESWEELDLGWCEAVAFHPETGSLFAGDVNEGVMESLDGGTTWQPFTVDSPADLKAAAIMIPVGNMLVVATTFNSVFSSPIEGPRAWQQVSTSNVRLIDSQNAAAVDPFAPDTTAVLGSSIGVLKSSDGGTSFELKNRGLDAMQVWISIDAHRNELYATGSSSQVGYGVFRSRDRGRSWSSDVNGLWGGSWAQTSAVSAGPSSVYLINAGVPARRDHTSNDWSRFGSDGWHRDPFGAKILADPCESGVAYMARGGQGPRRTTDGGASWQFTTTAGEAGWPDPVGDVTALVAEARRDETAGGPCHAVLYAATVISFQEGQSSHLLRSDDGGFSWTELRLEPAADQGLETIYKIQALGSGRIFVSTNGRNGPRLYRSLDAGSSWLELTGDGPLPTARLHGEELFAFSESQPLVGYAFGTDDRRSGLGRSLFFTADGGDSWYRLSSAGLGEAFGTLKSFAVDPDDPSRLYAGSSHGIYSFKNAPPQAPRPSADR
jgi:photosystem II stability/assembly factor-like uncharacterized protein